MSVALVPQQRGPPPAPEDAYVQRKLPSTTPPRTAYTQRPTDQLFEPPLAVDPHVDIPRHQVWLDRLRHGQIDRVDLMPDIGVTLVLKVGAR